MGNTKENQSSKVPTKEFLTKTVKDISYDKDTLERVLKHLSKEKKKKKKPPTNENCKRDPTDKAGDRQVQLKCRQLPNVARELRAAVMRQDWDEVTTLVMILCQPGLAYYSTIIMKVCFLLLLNHPKSNSQLLENFIRLSTPYIMEEDVKKFIKILFALRKTPLKPLTTGKYKRKTGDYKVVRDPEFEKL